MTEQDKGLPQIPRSEFTFFPVGDEAERVSQMDALHLAKAASEQPEMLVSLFHELWRNHREQDMYDMSTYLGSMEPWLLFIDEVPFDLVFMHVEHDEPLLQCEAFVGETLTVLAKSIAGVPVNGLLTPDLVQRVFEVYQVTMDQTNEFITQYRSPQA